MPSTFNQMALFWGDSIRSIFRDKISLRNSRHRLLLFRDTEVALHLRLVDAVDGDPSEVAPYEHAPHRVTDSHVGVEAEKDNMIRLGEENIIMIIGEKFIDKSKNVNRYNNVALGDSRLLTKDGSSRNLGHIS